MPAKVKYRVFKQEWTNSAPRYWLEYQDPSIDMDPSRCWQAITKGDVDPNKIGIIGDRKHFFTCLKELHNFAEKHSKDVRLLYDQYISEEFEL